MRAHEFITEAVRGRVPQDLVDKSQGSVKLTRDTGGYDRAYHMNRLMMAMAMSDGGRGPVDMDAASWYEKYNIMFPYTDLEAAMVNQAIATIPTDTKGVIARGKSVENPGTNKTSPVAQQKKNRYGV
jgi:hypothetical protein